MGARSTADPFITAPMPGILGDDSSELEGEDIGGGGGARSPSDMEVGGTSNLLLRSGVQHSEPRRSAPTWVLLVPS